MYGDRKAFASESFDCQSLLKKNIRKAINPEFLVVPAIYSFLNFIFLLMVVERFLKYVKFSTQSNPHSGLTPSTPGQMEFAHFLSEEMKAVGLQEVEVSEFGYVMGFLPSNMERETPAIGFIAHMDTSPEMKIGRAHV